MADLDTDAIRADMDEPMSVLGYRRRLQDALAEIDALRARLVAIEKLCEDGTIRDNWTAIQVLAAARGEGNLA